jgi:teichuronic acid biosynthesis glycosyltransferase TuaG
MSLVSIIMPAYNSEKYIASSIESVLRQSWQDWKLLIVDDGSHDTTLEIIRKYAGGDDRITVFSTEGNLGAAKARNLAIQYATGRFIAFLDSDDLWKARKLEKQIAFMQMHNLAFTFTSYDRIDELGNLINLHYVEKPVTYHDLLKTCVIGCLTGMYDTKKLGKVYMPDIRKRQDFGLWLRILKRVDAAYPISESLAQYRVRSGSVSANKLMAAKFTWSIYRDVEKLGLWHSAYYFVQYAAHGVLNSYVKPRWSRRDAI